MQWYYKVLGEVVGPLTAAQMREKVEHGEIGPQTLVRKGAHGRWVAASQVNNLLPSPLDNAPAEPLDGHLGSHAVFRGGGRRPATREAASAPLDASHPADTWPPKLTAPTPVSGLAVASLILGIASCMLLALAGLPALVTGWRALHEIAHEKMRGRGAAVLGMVLGGLSCAATMVLAGWFWLRVPGGSLDVAEFRLRAVGAANMQHALDRQIYVRHAVLDRGGRPALSWRVLLLPYLGQRDLYARFRMDEPWQGPHNEALVRLMPEAYCSPHVRPATGRTNALAPIGPGTLFAAGRETAPHDVPDDKSLTIFVVEADDWAQAAWSSPSDLAWDPEHPTAALGELRGGRFLALMLDGSTRLISTGADPAVLRAVFTAFGRERVDPAALGMER
jgi:hypothetical protein